MTRMSKPQRDKIYKIVAQKELFLSNAEFRTLTPSQIMRIGDHCRMCGVEVRKDKGIINPATGLEYPQGQIDHIDGNDDNNSLQNQQILCISDNHKKNPRGKAAKSLEEPHQGDMEISREKSDSIEFRPTYVRNLTKYLQDNEHSCLEETYMNSYNLSDGGGRQACARYLSEEMITKINAKGKFQTFRYSCNSKYCRGEHLCLTGEKPESLLDAERNRLTHKWENDYGQHRDTWKKHTSTATKPWMELDEYIETHCSLLSYNFK